MIKEYLKYKLKATNLHGIHSPFVYKLYQNVIATRNTKPIELIEERRSELKRDQSFIEVHDLGAGTRKNHTNKRKIASITSNAALPQKYALLLSRLVKYTEAEDIIEVGASVGLTTAYLSKAAKNGTVNTFEGCPNIAAIAKETLKICKVSNANIHIGEFSNTLPKCLQTLEKVDFAFIDGNHQMAPAIQYFNLLMEKIHQQSVLIFDDINWSAEMRQAWNTIKKDNRVVVTVDLFKLGIVFFNRGQAKENFTLRF